MYQALSEIARASLWQNFLLEKKIILPLHTDEEKIDTVSID